MGEERKAKEEAKMKAGLTPPKELFNNRPGYGPQRDEKGIPTHDDKGEELKKSAIKKLMKEYNNHVKLHEKAKKYFENK